MKDVFDGLELNSRCNYTQIGNYEYKRPATSVKGFSVYVDSKNGNNDNDGTIESPLLDIHAALNKCRSISNTCTIVLREGIYYIKKTIKLYPCDSNLSIIGYKNEKVIINGGIEITNIKWESYYNDIIVYTDVNVGDDVNIEPSTYILFIFIY